MSGIDDDVNLAVERKREEANAIIKFMIAALSTILGWKCLGTGLSPLDTDFGAIMVYISAVFVYVAALRAKLSCTHHSIWLQIIGDVAELAGQLASVALVIILFRPFGLFAFGVWLFWLLWIAIRWLQNFYPDYLTRVEAIKETVRQLVHPSATKQVEQSCLPV